MKEWLINLNKGRGWGGVFKIQQYCEWSTERLFRECIM